MMYANMFSYIYIYIYVYSENAASSKVSKHAIDAVAGFHTENRPQWHCVLF